MASDDLEYNSFYKSLQTTFRKKYEEAQSKCMLICIPVRDSIAHVTNISCKFADVHLLKTSPYFKNQYISSDRKGALSFEIENGYINVMSDTSADFKVKIMAEELGYNNDLKPFRILMIEKPLDASFHAHGDVNNGVETVNYHTFNDCKTFLFSDDTHIPVLTHLITKINQFNSNYLILPDYLYDAACKLKDLIDWASVELFLVHKPRLRSDEKMAKEISSALESFVIGSVHPKLFPVIREKFKASNQTLLNKLNRMRNISAKGLGIDEALQCPLPRTVSKMSSLSNLITPSSKIKCLHKVLATIAEEIKEHNSVGSFSVKKGKVPCLTSDDLIPILVKVLIEVEPHHILSDLYYVENFQWNVSNKDRLCYSVVTFRAAVEFIKMNNLSSTDSKVGAEAVEEEQLKTKSAIDTPVNIDGVVDRELTRITRMVEASTKELSSVEITGVPSSGNKVKVKRKENSLGGFLSSLQQDSIGCSYGKQT